MSIIQVSTLHTSERTPPLVTLVVVPRERFSGTQSSLESLYQRTQYPFRLIYVDVNSPPHVQRYLVSQATEKGFKLLRIEHFLSPNQARNVAIPYIDTRYVVFVDNDVTVTPNWLTALVQCAEETQAAICSPLILFPPAAERSPETYPYNAEQVAIHSAGGQAHFETVNTQKVLVRRQNFQNQPLSIAQPKLCRAETELAEFHCVLIRTSIFDEVGVFDEHYLSVREDTDFCLLVRDRGHCVYVEPQAVVFYTPPLDLEASDLPFFFLRWSREWTERSVQHFQQKWQIEPEFDKSAAVLNWVENHYNIGKRAQERLKRSAPYQLHSSATLWHATPSSPIDLSEIQARLETSERRTQAIKKQLESLTFSTSI